MKLSLIVSVITLVFVTDIRALTEGSESTPNILIKTENISSENNERLRGTPNNTTRNVNTKILRMPKIPLNIHTKNDVVTLVVTTRRPLMKIKKCTIKPHIIQHTNLQTSAEQINFSKGNSNVRKRFQIRNKNAESVNIKSVTPYTFPNADKLGLKGMLAIDRSLQNIKSLRRKSSEKLLNEELKIHSSQNSTSSKTENNTEIVIKTNKLGGFATTKENIVPFAITTEKQIQALTKKTHNIQSNLPREIEINKTNTSTITESLHSINTLQNLVPLRFITETPMTIEQINNASSAIVDNLDAFKTKVRNLPNANIRTDSLDYDNMEKMQDLNSATAKSAVLFPNTENSGIYLNALDEKNKFITKDNYISTDGENNSNFRTYNPAVVAPKIKRYEVISIGSSAHPLVQRRKRHINIIEEERVATTSTGLKFNHHEKPLGVDSTFKNIHA